MIISEDVVDCPRCGRYRNKAKRQAEQGDYTGAARTVAQGATRMARNYVEEVVELSPTSIQQLFR